MAFDALEEKHREAGKGPYVDEDDPAWDALEAETAADWEQAHARALADWDAWFDQACDTVDRLLAEPCASTPSTLSGLSTSALASAP
ncbi:MAG: hypothetical protein EON47_20580 [Acetobacteraceae bacterium]|nr:MAG: hypothetical protein EON47_20580 [Acetobacteraceae bacterium]